MFALVFLIIHYANYGFNGVGFPFSRLLGEGKQGKGRGNVKGEKGLGWNGWRLLYYGEDRGRNVPLIC